MNSVTESVRGGVVYTMALLIGVSLHQTLFRFGEWDTWSFKLLMAAGIGQIGVSLLLWHYDGHGASAAIFHAAGLLAAVLAGVWSSMLTYRAFFHRLCRFPGPFGARLSAFYMTRRSVKRFQTYKEMESLHAKYGDVVRVGPTELSVADPAAFAAIYSASSPCSRGPWYNILNPTISLQMVRDTKEHARRRKAWDKAFSRQAMRDYQGRLNSYTASLLSIIDLSAQKSIPLNVSKWFHFYTWDVMGALSFGQNFNMLRDGIEHYWFRTTHANLVLIGAFSRVVWLFPIFLSTPILNREYLKFRRWSRGEVQKRMNSPEAEAKDVFHWILADYRDKPTPPGPSWQDTENLYGDAGLIIVAGSDTTAATLACLFYQFARHPSAFNKLQAEVDSFFPALRKGDQELDNNDLARLPYLQACIDESMRLLPPVPSGLQRQTPPQGLRIGDDLFIPGNVIVQVPSYTLYRDPRVFVKGDEFIPERWTTQPELVHEEHAAVFAPFSVGRFSCVGKQLGLMEVRRVAVLLASRYDVRFATDSDMAGFEEGMMDLFTLALPDLNIVFTPRL